MLHVQCFLFVCLFGGFMVRGFLRFLILFKYFRSTFVVRYLWCVFSRFWASLAADHAVFYQNCGSIFCDNVPNFFSLCFEIEIGREERSNFWGMLKCKTFGSFSPCFWADEGVAFITNAWNSKNVTCNCVSDVFYFTLWSKSAGRSAIRGEQAERCLLLDLHKILKVPHVFGC